MSNNIQARRQWNPETSRQKMVARAYAVPTLSKSRPVMSGRSCNSEQRTKWELSKGHVANQIPAEEANELKYRKRF
jgi:hypothetical protein